jgi:hypothetical protein
MICEFLFNWIVNGISLCFLCVIEFERFALLDYMSYFCDRSIVMGNSTFGANKLGHCNLWLYIYIYI